jgi:hypothetical protein
MTIEAEQTMAKLHNAHWLGTGYDILELDPLDAGSGKKQRLVEFKKWIDDRESGVSRPAGTRYGTGTVTKIDDRAEVLVTNSDFQSKFSSKFNVKASGQRRGVKGSFGLSHSLERLRKETRATGRLVTHAEAVVRIGEIGFEGLLSDQLPPHELLTDELRRDVESVGTGGTSAAKLVEKYGTHFSSRVAIGGRAYRQVVIDASSFSYMGSKGMDVGVTAALSFKKNFKADSDAGVHKNWVDTFDQLDGAKAQQLRVNGGLLRDSLQAWSETVQDDHNAVPVELTLLPITDLLTAQYFPDLSGDVEEIRRQVGRVVDDALRSRYKEPLLSIRYADTFQSGGWTDQGSKGNVDVGWYEPDATDGYYVLAFLQYAHRTKDRVDKPYGLSVLAKPAADGDTAQPMFAPPTEWIERHRRDWWGNKGSFWIPRQPDGYRALGMIALPGQPNADSVKKMMANFRCVRKDLVVDGRYGACSWYSDAFSKKPVAVWPILSNASNAVEVGGFIAYNSDHDQIPEPKGYPKKCLDAQAIWPE